MLGHILMMSISLFTALGLGGARADELKRFEFESKHMGTVFRIVLYAADATAAQAASQAAFARIAELDSILSDYNAKSELLRACQANDAAPDQPIPVSQAFLAALLEAERLAKLTDGYFDVTVGPVVRLWRNARRTQQLPEPNELADALKLVGFDKVRLDPSASTLRMKLPKMRLDFGGIGKGYAAQEALNLLKEKGYPHALVAGSGDVTVGDRPPGQPGWRVEILPLTKNEPRRVLLLTNCSVSTSGDLDQFVEIGGVRYSHVINPKTGLPLTGRRSVTVISRGGAQTDALTKAASTMPLEQALKLIESLPDTAGFWAIQEQGADQVQHISSKRFQQFLHK